MSNLKDTFKDVLKTVCRYLISKNEFSSEWAKNISYIRDIFAAIRDEVILIELRTIIQSIFNYDDDNNRNSLNEG